MALFVIADLHLSLSGDKPMDVFAGWTNYVERLEKNWRAIVKEEDTVVIAGDISWAMRLEEIYEDFKFINELPGKKLISKGNHDYWWTSVTKMNKYVKDNGFNTISFLHNNAYAVGEYAVCGTRGWYYDAENDADMKVLNREVGRLKISIEQGLKLGENLKPVVFLHYPPVYADTPCKEILDVLYEYKIEKCYYGHIHGGNASKRAENGMYNGVKLRLIACDYINFTPVLVM